MNFTFGTFKAKKKWNEKFLDTLAWKHKCIEFHDYFYQSPYIISENYEEKLRASLQNKFYESPFLDMDDL